MKDWFQRSTVPAGTRPLSGPTILEQSEEDYRETETPVRETLWKAKSRAEREVLTGAEKTRC